MAFPIFGTRTISNHCLHLYRSTNRVTWVTNGTKSFGGRFFGPAVPPLRSLCIIITTLHYVLRDRGCRSPDKDVRDEERAALAAEPPSESTHVLSIYRRNRRRKITWRKLLRGNDLQQKVTLNQQENGGGRLKKVEGNFRKSLIISK